MICDSTLDRRNDRVAVLRSEVSDENGRLLATAIGSFSIFPAERLGEHDHGPAAPDRSPTTSSVVAARYSSNWKPSVLPSLTPSNFQVTRYTPAPWYP